MKCTDGSNTIEMWRWTLSSILSLTIMAVHSCAVHAQAARSRLEVVNAETQELSPAAPIAGRGEAGEDEIGEDPEKVVRHWNESLSPENYRRAVAMLRTNRSESRGGPSIALGPWTRIGPIGDFESTIGEFKNGRMTNIHIRPHGSSHYVYASACSGGLWRALASAGTGVWTSLGDNLENPSVRAFAVNPNNADDIIVATGDWLRSQGAGVFRTLDAGNTWDEIPQISQIERAACRVIWSTENPNFIWIGTTYDPKRPWDGGGIWRSLDGGATWENRMNSPVTDMAVHPLSWDFQYACIAGTGVFRTTDGWQSSQQLTNGLPAGSSFGRASIAICRDAPSNVAIIVHNGNTLQGVYKSTDNGGTWTNITAGVTGIENLSQSQSWHAQAITFRPNNPSEIFVGAVLLARTVDGGSTWQVGDAQTGIDHAHDDITQLYFSATTGNSVLWILNDGGIYRHDLVSQQTVSWNGNSSTGLNCSQVNQGMDAELGLQAIGLQDNGAARTTSMGPSWMSTAICDCQYIEGVDQGFWFNQWCGGAIQLWDCATATCPDPIATGLSDHGNGSLFYRRDDRRLYNCVGSNVQSTPVDGTLGWSVDTNLPLGDASQIYGSEIKKLLFVNFGTSRLLWAEYTVSNWLTNSVMLQPTDEVKCIWASREVPTESWAGCKSHPGEPKLFHTVDQWQSWEDISGTLSGVGKIEAIVSTPFNSRQIFVGTDVGVFVTEDGGSTWQSFQDGLPIVGCTGLRYIVDPTGSRPHQLVVSTYGRGVYVRPLAGPPIDYVDPGNLVTPSIRNGTFEQPFSSFDTGLATVPTGGVLALRGESHPATLPVTISRAMTIRAYDDTATVGQ